MRRLSLRVKHRNARVEGRYWQGTTENPLRFQAVSGAVQGAVRISTFADPALRLGARADAAPTMSCAIQESRRYERVLLP